MLWEGLHERLCRFICSRLADEADAEDILQDVFVQIHTHIQSVRDMSRLEAWIYQVARNSIIDFYRNQHRYIKLGEISSEEPFPEEDAAISLAPCLRSAVNALPEPYRTALYLTEYEGLSQKELSEQLGISFSGAKSRVQRARQKVREFLLVACHMELEANGIPVKNRELCCCCES